MDALNQTNHHRKGHGMGTAVRHKWQWNPRYRGNSHGHAEVLEPLPQNHGEDARAQQRAEAILAELGCAVYPPQNDGKQPKDYAPTQHPELLSHR